MLGRMIVATIWLGMAASPALAGEYGRAIVNGHEIILNDDGTWKLSGNPQPADNNVQGACTILKSKKIPVSYCLNGANWSNRGQSGSFETLFASKDEDVYAGLIAEKLYIPVDKLKDVVLTNARNASSIEGVNIVGESETTFQGQKWKVIEFTATVQAVKFEFMTFYNSVEGKGTAQFAFWSAADQAEALKKATQNFWVHID